MRMKNDDDEDDHEAEDEDVTRTFDQDLGARPPQTQRHSRDVALLQQSCAKDSEMLILGNSSFIIRW